MKFRVTWNETDYIWPIGTDPELDGKLVAGEQMKVLARVAEEGGNYLLLGVADPDAGMYESEFRVPRGKTLEVILQPVLNGVEGVPADPVRLLYPFPMPPKPAGVELSLR